jgi:hypothetical protein
MKKLGVLFVYFMLVTGLIYAAEPTDTQIRQAAETLGVPFADLKHFVQSYQPKTEQAGAIKIEAKKLYDEYDANQLKADGLYTGKTLQVTGKVYGIDKEYSGEYYLKLEPYGWVKIYFQASELNKIVDLSKSQTVVVVGRCEGYNSTVKIIDAYLVK